MAGIAGSHSNSLAPMVPGVKEAQAGMQALADAKPILMQPPQQMSEADVPAQPTPSPTPEPTPVPQAQAFKPSLDDLMSQAQQEAPKEKPSLDDLMKQAKAEEKPKNWYDISPSGLASGIVEDLPAIGAMTGAAVAGTGGALMAGPAGAFGAGVAGAGLGKEAGESLKQTIQGMSGSAEAPKSRAEQYQRLGDAAKSGALEQALGEGAAGIVKAVPDMLANAGSKLSGISKMSIKTYAKAADKVETLINQYGPELAGAADDIKQGFHDAIQGAKSALSDQISATLKNAKDRGLTVSVEPVLKALDDMVGTASEAMKKMKPEEIAELKKLREKIASVANPNGMAKLTDIHELKGLLQEEAAGAYASISGGVPQAGKGSFFEKGAKSAARAARNVVDAAAPEVTEANKQLQKFYDLADELSPSILNKKAADSSLVQGGRGLNAKAMGDLQKLGNLTGVDALGQAQALAAAKDFANPAMLKNYTQSPAGVKMLIDAGRFTAPVIKALGGPEAMSQLANTPYGKAYLGQLAEKIAAGSGVDKFVKQFKKPIPVDNAPAK